jgi:hypothetical protein
MIENPQSAWLPLLWVALPGIAFAAYALNAALFSGEDRHFCTIPAIGLVLALLPAHVLALTVGSLSVALAVSWIVIGMAGCAWITRHWQEFRSALSNRHPQLARTLAITALATLPIVLPTILLNFHDEGFFNGHQSIIAHLQNGTYPPRYLYEPSLPLRYHYGFDLAGAIVTGLLRIRVDQAIDLLTLALWPCMFLLLWRVGEQVGGRRAGLFVALAVCFSGGVPVLCASAAFLGAPIPIAEGLLNLCTINGLPVNPPFISYYFQHPWSIAVPLFCLVVLQRAALPQLDNQRLGLVALACSLLLLSLCHAVLFVMTVFALGLAESWNFVRFRDRLAPPVLLSLGASLLGAKLIGGFFVSGPYPLAGGFFETGFYVRDFGGGDAIALQVLWNFSSFGVLPLLGIVGLFRARHGKVFMVVLASLGLVIMNSLRYQYTWDIVKFGIVSVIVLAIGAGIALSDLANWANTRSRKVFYRLMVIALFGEGVIYPFSALYFYNPHIKPHIAQIKPYLSAAYPVDRDNARAVSFLRTHLGPSEIIYRTTDKATPYGVWGGLPTQASVYPAAGGDDDAYGLGKEKFAARTSLESISPNWLDRLSAERVDWVVTDPSDVPINALLESSEGKGRVSLAAQFGNVRVFHLD